MRIIGIDPGRSGALVSLSPTGEIECKHRLPFVDSVLDLHQLRAMLGGLVNGGPVHIFLEEVSIRPIKGADGASRKFSAGTATSFMRWAGAIEGLLAGMGLPYTMVRPQTWQKAVLTGTPAGMDSKDRSLLVAKRLYPNTKFTFDESTERAIKDQDGVYDALMIATYGRKSILGTAVEVGHEEATA